MILEVSVMSLTHAACLHHRQLPSLPSMPKEEREQVGNDAHSLQQLWKWTVWPLERQFSSLQKRRGGFVSTSMFVAGREI